MDGIFLFIKKYIYNLKVRFNLLKIIKIERNKDGMFGKFSDSVLNI